MMEFSTQRNEWFRSTCLLREGDRERERETFTTKGQKIFDTNFNTNWDYPMEFSRQATEKKENILL